VKKTMPTCFVAAACMALVIAAGSEEKEKKPAPLYTNDDLRRVSPYRDETGGSSPPADVAPAPAARGSATKGRIRGEEYWRREADRLRDRLRPLRERAAELRLTIEERRLGAEAGRRRRGSRPGITVPVTALEHRLRMLEDRIREAESRLEDRARREGAMPGWMR
jgi:hypothetical protein